MAELAVPPALAAPTPQIAAEQLARRSNLQRAAQDFESQFLSIMFQEMFEGVETDGPFGGGQAETMWRSFLTDAMGRQVARAGGIGVSAAVQREMLRLQEQAQANPSQQPPSPGGSA